MRTFTLVLAGALLVALNGPATARERGHRYQGNSRPGYAQRVVRYPGAVVNRGYVQNRPIVHSNGYVNNNGYIPQSYIRGGYTTPVRAYYNNAFNNPAYYNSTFENNGYSNGAYYNNGYSFPGAYYNNGYYAPGGYYNTGGYYNNGRGVQVGPVRIGY